MKVYISGPITGYDLDERKQYFEAAERSAKAELQPQLIVNPMKLVNNCLDNWPCDAGQLADAPPYIHTWSCWMRLDIKAMMDCDTILMLPNWTESPGAMIEYQIAQLLKFKVIHMDNLGVTSEP